MFRTLLECPHCKWRIALEDARTEIPQPELSTTWKKVQLVYTICPECRRDFRVTGERRAAAILLMAVLASLLAANFMDSWWPLVLGSSLLLLQNKVKQLLIRAEHA
ncbi:hypothetical protein [Thermomonas fusca]|uniref:Uncharacterized protein n=1 Tax=Thermomonas fusca TaxID=215690 RepID=A0A5R9PDM8_9GAMM|nr:hypothetical protein [Thermomonas fusca]TLX20680.1 hypothetical protein E5S66_13400 [Thermomonas fusca]